MDCHTDYHAVSAMALTGVTCSTFDQAGKDLAETGGTGP
jgi:hypothetical protein